MLDPMWIQEQIQPPSYYSHEPWLSKSLNTSLNSLMQVRGWGSIMASSPKYDDMQGIQWKLNGGQILLTSHMLATWGHSLEVWWLIRHTWLFMCNTQNLHQEGFAHRHSLFPYTKFLLWCITKHSSSFWRSHIQVDMLI